MTNKDDYLTDTENNGSNTSEENISASSHETLTNINKNFTGRTDDLDDPANRAKTQKMPESLARAISQSIQADEEEELSNEVKNEKNKKHHKKGCFFIIFILLLLLASIAWCIQNQEKLPASISNIIKDNEKYISVVKNFVKEKTTKNNIKEENDEEEEADEENIQVLDSDELSPVDNIENKILDNEDSEEVTEEEISFEDEEELDQEVSENQERSKIEDETLNKEDSKTENKEINKDNINNEEKDETESPLALELSQFADQLNEIENGKHVDIDFDDNPAPSEEETDNMPQNDIINNETVNNIKNSPREDSPTSESIIKATSVEDKKIEAINHEELIDDREDEEISNVDTSKTSAISETVENNDQEVKTKKIKKLNYKLATKNILLAKNLPSILKWTVVLDEDIDDMVRVVTDSAKQYDFDPLFIAAIIMSESSFDSEIVSESGKIGLLQIDPEKAPEIAELLNVEWLGSEALKDPEYNLKLGVGFLNYCLKNHQNDFQGGMYAYNQGDDSKELDENAQVLFNRYMDNIKFYLKSWGGHLPK